MRLSRSASLQRRLVVDEAARRRDEIGMRLHQREFARADHAAVVLGQRTGDRDDNPSGAATRRASTFSPPRSAISVADR